jgi:subtilisin family serine protease
MKLFLAILALSLVAQAEPLAPGYVRLTIKYPSSEVKKAGQKLDFGLTEKQKDQILRLTGSDFREIYSVDVPAAQVAELQRVENVVEKYDRVMPPPGTFADVDPEIKDQWWIKALKVDEAWKMASGKGVTVADCDAGFYINESDIKGNLLLEHAKDFSDTQNPDRIDDGNYVFHGTAVAAITSGVLDGSGTNGIAYDSKFVPLQNYNYGSQDRTNKEEATAKCILHALTVPDVKVIMLENQTYGSSETFLGTREAVRAALKAGVTIVSAGGNSGNELTDEAADDTGSIIVGALEQSGDRASFSNWGKRIAVAAFGRNLWTLYGPNGQFGQFSGTSGATPQVGGTVALMLEINPALTPEKVKEILEKTRVASRATEGVGGLLDAQAAVTMAKDTVVEVQTMSEREILRSDLVQILTR